MMKLLSFSGKASHGKDTCARIAQRVAKQEFGVNLGQFAFAWPLKTRVFGQMTKYSFEDVFQHKPEEVRNTLQIEGTEKGRDVCGNDFWVRQTEAYLRLFEESMPFIEGVTISDARFMNEVEMVKRHGLAIYIESNRPTLQGQYSQHASETALDHIDKHLVFDGIIINNHDTTLESLEEQIRPLVARLLQK